MFSLNADLFLVFCLSSLVFIKSYGKYPQPPNCLNAECAPYEVIRSEKDYEIRSYEDAYWVSALPIVSDSYQSATDKSFRLLFSYFFGNNGDDKYMLMLAPALVDVQKPLADDDGHGTSYNLSFIVPRKYQRNIPKPYLSDEIVIVKLPRHKYCAVRRFAGKITDDIITTEIAALRKTLKGTPYERAASVQNFSLAVFDLPFLYDDSINEAILWFD